jgi:hypothetical protein
MKLILMAVMSLSFSVAFADGQDRGNGGDAVSQEFTSLGQEAVKYFAFLGDGAFSKEQQEAFKNAVAKTTIVTSEKLTLNGAEVDAINYPNQLRIEVSRQRWWSKELSPRESHFKLALHEYLWVSGVDDSEYKISNPLYISLMAVRERQLQTPIGKTLTDAVCMGIITRDKATIEQALQMGANVEGTCHLPATVRYTCPNGKSDSFPHLEDTRYDKSPLELSFNAINDSFYYHLCNKGPIPAAKDDILMREIIGLILSYHPEVNKISDFGLSLLDRSIQDSSPELFHMLLKAGGSPTLGLSALLNFDSYQDPLPLALYEEMLTLGADVNADRSHVTPGHPTYTFALSSFIVGGPRRDVLELFASSKKIDYCKETDNPYFFSKHGRVIDFARREYLQLIRSVGGACVPH